MLLTCFSLTFITSYSWKLIYIIYVAIGSVSTLIIQCQCLYKMIADLTCLCIWLPIICSAYDWPCSLLSYFISIGIWTLIICYFSEEIHANIVLLYVLAVKINKCPIRLRLVQFTLGSWAKITCSLSLLADSFVMYVFETHVALAWHPFHEEYFVSGSLDGSIFHWLVG